MTATVHKLRTRPRGVDYDPPDLSHLMVSTLAAYAECAELMPAEAAEDLGDDVLRAIRTIRNGLRAQAQLLRPVKDRA